MLEKEMKNIKKGNFDVVSFEWWLEKNMRLRHKSLSTRGNANTIGVKL